MGEWSSLEHVFGDEWRDIWGDFVLSTIGEEDQAVIQPAGFRRNQLFPELSLAFLKPLYVIYYDELWQNKLSPGKYARGYGTYQGPIL
jgi:hypothetical protein